MSSASPEAVKKQVQIYIRIFVTLAVFTVITVLASYIHLPFVWTVALALLIASFKASLVASFFMHLNHEKKIIWSFLILAFVFFLFLLIIPSITRF